jgi:hypothetical protein
MDIKGGVEAPPKEDELEVRTSPTTSIAMSNTRTQDVGLLFFGGPEPV